MAGEYVPLVLFPRHTTLAGRPSSINLTTVAMDVTPYERAIVTFWRGKIIGTAPSSTPPYAFAVALEGSTDQVVWTPYAPEGATWTGTPVDGWELTENSQHQMIVILSRRWFRLRVRTFANDNVATCWAVGFLERRIA